MHNLIDWNFFSLLYLLLQKSIGKPWVVFHKFVSCKSGFVINYKNIRCVNDNYAKIQLHLKCIKNGYCFSFIIVLIYIIKKYFIKWKLHRISCYCDADFLKSSLFEWRMVCAGVFGTKERERKWKGKYRICLLIVGVQV